MQSESSTPRGVCECGCGQVTNLISMTDTARGVIKGEPRRYILGHARRGKTFSDESRALISSRKKGTPPWNTGRRLILESRVCEWCAVDKPIAEFRRSRRTCRSCRPLRDHNLSWAAYCEMLADQDGRCAICQTATPGQLGIFAVDHDHTCCPTPGRKRGCCGQCVRGLLCWSCNVGLGHMQDKPERLRKAAAYLEERER